MRLMWFLCLSLQMRWFWCFWFWFIFLLIHHSVFSSLIQISNFLFHPSSLFPLSLFCIYSFANTELFLLFPPVLMSKLFLLFLISPLFLFVLIPSFHLRFNSSFSFIFKPWIYCIDWVLIIWTGSDLAAELQQVS